MKKIIYITGLIGSGKSFLMKALMEKLPGLYIFTDEVAKELMNSTKIHQQLVDLYGFSFDIKKQDDRDRIKEALFGQRNLKQKMEDIVHPAVHEQIQRMISSTDEEWVFIESALPINHKYDATIAVVCSDEKTRHGRLKEFRGYDIEKTKTIESRQRSLIDCYRLADFVVDTVDKDVSRLDVSRVLEWLDLVVHKQQKWATLSGSFLPFTIGHESVVLSSLKTFDRVYVMQAYNESKKNLYGTFPLPSREDLPLDMQDRVIFIEPEEKFTVFRMKEYGSHTQIRGIRDEDDAEYERKIFEVNRFLDPGIETFTSFSDPNLKIISSSLYRASQKMPGAYAFLPKYVKVNPR